MNKQQSSKIKLVRDYGRFQRFEFIDINSKINGKSIEYDDEGNICTIRNYVNGVLHGLFIDYYEDGNILSISHYVNGKENGVSRVFDEEI